MAPITELSIRDHGDDNDEVWITHYSSNHQILLVGEGDFSFSCSLATRFGSASNIVASSLDSNADDVVRKYKKARSNLEALKRLGASLLHGVDATKLHLHPHLNCRKFDRIIFNFPHAGFHGKETDSSLIKKHRELVFGFLHGASHMVRATTGEVHVSHKNKAPFSHWKLEELASKCSLALTQCVVFKKSQYPGYENKRGDGSRCDMPFLLGECSTFKFRVSRVAKEIYAEKVKGREMKERESKCSQAQKQLQVVSQRPVLTFGPLSYNLTQVPDPLVQSRQRALPLNPREHRCSSHIEDTIANHARFQEKSVQLDPLRYIGRSSHDFPFQTSHHPQEERFFLDCSSRFGGVPLDIHIKRMQSTLTQTSFPHQYTGESQERYRQEPFFQRSNRFNGFSHAIYNEEGQNSMLTSASFPHPYTGESQEGSLTRQSMNLNLYPPRLW
ncbi:unnamed protein product [Eruca vesicaria subsp. sativa]|uniref:25S rRNA (uridine-N(3))-methyltransferase BMT5-like domain-containing protein n=1 Tax=Eruca vesicaria subsp. sativa TaxID=29727 RepID=A0ABC8M7K3_ERUVS|nr:unnamed protein product [Eruca vesicaria subsp. sativa]